MSFDITVDELRAIGGSKWARVPGTLGAFIAEMDFGMAEPVARRLHEAIDCGQVGYLTPGWLDALREATADFYERLSGFRPDPRYIVEVPDVVNGLEIVLRDFVYPGARVIVLTPAYMPFLWVPQLRGHEVIQVPMIRTETEWLLDYDQISDVLRPGDLLVLVNPHNPVGKVYTREELTQLAQIVADQDAKVFADELHSPLIYEGTHVSFASLNDDAAQATITAISASKSWNLAGLKCAQLILTGDDDRAKIPHLGEHEPSTLGVFANTVAYTEGAAWMDEVRAYLKANRDYVSERIADVLPGVRYLEPHATYLAWFELPDSGLRDGICDFFRDRAQVALTAGIECGECGRDAVRLNFGTTRAILTQMLDQMAEAYASRG